MKKEYIIPQIEEIELKSRGALLIESMPKSEDEVSGGLASEFFDNGGSEDW